MNPGFVSKKLVELLGLLSSTLLNCLHSLTIHTLSWQTMVALLGNLTSP